MARAWITDRWVKDAIIDGQRTQPTSAQKRNIKNIPDQFRTTRFGQGSRWLVEWITPDGKRRTKSATSRADAEQTLAGLEDDLRAGRYIDPAHAEMTYQALAELWIASKQRVKDSTLWRYQRDLDRWVYPQWGRTPVSAITPVKINAWVSQLQAGTAIVSSEAKRRTKGGLAPKTINGIVALAFGSPLRWGVKQRWLTSNPLETVELPEPEHLDDMMCLTHLEVQLLANACGTIGTDHDRVLALTLAYTGMRINEALALDWQHVDLKARRIQVRQTWTVDKDGHRKLGSPKTWERRSVAIPAFLVAELESIQSPGWVFKAKRGGEIIASNWRNRTLTPAAAAIGLEGMHPHLFRHAAASLAIAAGADVKVIQTMLGHKSAAITLDVYGHLWGDRLDEVADALTDARRRALVSPLLPDCDQTAETA